MSSVETFCEGCNNLRRCELVEDAGLTSMLCFPCRKKRERRIVQLAEGVVLLIPEKQEKAKEQAEYEDAEFVEVQG